MAKRRKVQPDRLGPSRQKGARPANAPAHHNNARRRGQPRDRAQVLHDLRVQQEEIHIQNQQLIESQRLLEESRDRYVDLYDFAPVAIVTLCDNGVIREINLAAAALLGAPRHTLLETPFIPFVAQSHRRAFLEHLRMCRGARSGMVKSALLLRNRKGLVIDVELSSNPPTPPPQGATGVRYSSALVDLTERRAIEEQRERLRLTLQSELLLRTVLGTLPVGVRVVDPAGQVIVQNAADAAIWADAGDPRVEWTGGRAWRVADDQPLRRENWPLARALRGERVLNEVLRLSAHHATLTIIRHSAVPLLDEDEQVVGAIGVSEDVTHLWRTQSELKHAKELAENANHLKDEFLATISHELRTPLSAVLLWSHLLRTGAVSESGRPAALETIYNSAKGQSQIIDDLLDLSRMTAGKLRISPEPLDLLPILRDALQSVRPAADARGLLVDLHADPDAHALAHAAIARVDRDRILQVLWNLLTNAIKFTPRGGAVTVSLAADDKVARIVVSDTGRGIPPDFLPHVFERFRQAETGTTRTQSGLGLGLSIVKQLVEMHGGAVSADSPGENMGSTFVVELPLAKLQVTDTTPAIQPVVVDADADAAHAPSDALVGTHVLLVEDDAITRHAIHRLLENAGAVVTSVDSAPAALKALDLARPDVLLSDLSMPGEDGYSLIRKVRQREAADTRRTANATRATRANNRHDGRPHLPAAAVTAHAMERDRRAAIEAGYEIHIPKPVDPSSFVHTIKKLAQGGFAPPGA